MPYLLAALGVLGAAAFWWYRVKSMRDAAGEVADVIGRVQGKIRRGQLRKKAALAPLTGIDDPVTAAATVVLAICAEGVPVSDALLARVREEIRTIAGSDKQLDEAMVYAKWASDQVADVPVVIDKTALLLKPLLSEDEKLQLVDMVLIASLPVERDPMFKRRVELLKRKLGLEVEG